MKLSGFGPALGNARNSFQDRGICYVPAFFEGFRQLCGLFADYGLGDGVENEFYDDKALTGLLMQRLDTAVAKVTRRNRFQLQSLFHAKPEFYFFK
jgi:hypothetical protein